MAKSKGYKPAPPTPPEDRSKWPTWAANDRPHVVPTHQPAVSPQVAVSPQKASSRAELSDQFEAGLSAVRHVLQTLRDAGSDVAGPIAALNVCASHSRDALTTYYPRNNTP